MIPETRGRTSAMRMGAMRPGSSLVRVTGRGLTVTTPTSGGAMAWDAAGCCWPQAARPIRAASVSRKRPNGAGVAVTGRESTDRESKFISSRGFALGRTLFSGRMLSHGETVRSSRLSQRAVKSCSLDRWREQALPFAPRRERRIAFSRAFAQVSCQRVEALTSSPIEWPKATFSPNRRSGIGRS